MTDKDLLEIIDFYYPNATGALLAGSNLNKERIDHESDIDVVIIDAQFSVVSALGISEKGLRFDFTQVPLSNIENVLINEKFDPRGTLLSMLSTGRILKESEHGLIELIKNRARHLYNTKNFLTKKFREDSTKNLLKIKKEFKRDLIYQKRFLIVCEFVNLVTQIEAATHSNWIHSGKHKANFLIENSMPFLEEIISLSKKMMDDKEGYDLSNIVNYIDFYILKLEKSEHGIKQNTFVLDITYPNINIQHFITSILPRIYNDDVLKDRFLYFYLSQKSSHRLYLNEICLVFTLKDSQTEKEIFLAVNCIFREEINANAKISLIPNWIYSEENKKLQQLTNFEATAKKINHFVIKDLKSFGIYDAERTIFVFIIISSFIAKEIDLDISDLIEMNKYLLNRWILSIKEQNVLKNIKDFERIKQHHISVFKSYFDQNKGLIINAIKKGLGYKQDHDDAQNKAYAEIISELNSFLILQKKEVENLTVNDPLTYHVLKNHYLLNNYEKSFLYVMVHEELIRVLILNNQQIALYLYNITEGINCLRKKIQDPILAL
jgi:hypothetical protein